MKKLMLYFLCISMIVSFYACGQDDTPDTSDETTQESGAGEPAETGDSEEASDSEASVGVISGIVFYDEDSSGTMDSSENGLEGLVINCGGQSCTTDSSGMYEFSTENSTEEISVDESSLPADYILTTGNSSQTVETAAGSGIASDIGYVSIAAEGLAFSEVLSTGAEYTNYHFILELTTSMGFDTMESWVMDSDVKYDAEGQIIFCISSQGTMGVYLKSTNQLTVTPITEVVEIESPFTIAEELDPVVFSSLNCTGTEELDGKTVYVYESTMPEYIATFYVWADNGIIIKMDVTEQGGTVVSYFFRDLSIGTVTSDDFVYPEGAEVFDVSNYADIGGMGELGDLGDIEMPEFP